MFACFAVAVFCFCVVFPAALVRARAASILLETGRGELRKNVVNKFRATGVSAVWVDHYDWSNIMSVLSSRNPHFVFDERALNPPDSSDKARNSERVGFLWETGSEFPSVKGGRKWVLETSLGTLGPFETAIGRQVSK